MLEAGAQWVRLTGSGPAMYTFVASADEADALARRLRETPDTAPMRRQQPALRNCPELATSLG